MVTMPPPKKKPAAPAGKKPKPQRTGKAINCWVPDQLHAAMLSFIEAQRVKPKVTDVVELALQEFLQREGHWPPKDEPAT
jgi:hypothetical protein